MRSLPLKLDPGSDLREVIEQQGKEKRLSGFVLSVVGNLSRAAFQCPGRPTSTVLEGNLEIITLNGTFSPEGVHLHLSISDGDCQVWGGHLESGSKVLKGVDLLLGLLDEPSQKIVNGEPFLKSREPRIEIAILPKCPWSSRALRILRTNQIPCKVRIIDSDDAFAELKKKTNLSTFPQLFIDEQFSGGYETLADLDRSGKLEEFK